MHILVLMKGAYLLVMKLDKDVLIAVGKLGVLSFKKGYYVYVGSALQGLDHRIRWKAFSALARAA